jgi:proliferating cell nuclear antigen PCNA
MDILINASGKAEQFTIIFQHLKTFCDHICIIFDKSQMYIQSMDNAHVCVVDLKLPSSWFNSYVNKTNDSLRIGVSANLLYKILSLRDKTQRIELKYDNDGDNDHLFISYTTGGEGSLKEFDKHFEIPLMDVDSEILDIPGIVHNAELSLKSGHFASIINQLKQFGDCLDIKCSDTKMVMEAKSIEQCKMTVDINIDDIYSFTIDDNINEENPLNITFSLNYLYMICLYHKLTEYVHIKISDAYPLKVVYYLDGVEPEEEAERDSVPNLSLYLAPKIDDSE